MEFTYCFRDKSKHVKSKHMHPCTHAPMHTCTHAPTRHVMKAYRPDGQSRGEISEILKLISSSAIPVRINNLSNPDTGHTGHTGHICM